MITGMKILLISADYFSEKILMEMILDLNQVIFRI